MIPNFGRRRQLPAAIFGGLSFSQLVLFRAELIGTQLIFWRKHTKRELEEAVYRRIERPV
jgi:hypothetical protein